MSENRKPPHRAQASDLPGLKLDPKDTRPLYWQIYGEIKRLILEGTVPSGNPMPSPRALSTQLACSRHTVATAYNYLVAEGLLDSAHGVGTFVSQLSGAIAGDLLLQQEVEDLPIPPPSQFYHRLTAGMLPRDEEDPLQVFGMPDSEAFPYDQWSKLHSRIWSRPKHSLVRAVSPLGYLGLREAICEMMHRTRGVRATTDQVLITSGTTQSLDLLLRVLLDPGDEVWIEDPGRPKVAALVHAQGMRPVHLPVDSAGALISEGERQAPRARAAVVTASHHYPTGVTMSLERRIELLSWASNNESWIFEDDYDGEMIATGKPLLPIYSLGKTNRTIYMGTFSKSISPQLRIGYIIAHPQVILALSRARYFLDYFPSMMAQPVLAAFINEGYLDSYVRRMRRLYKDRQLAFASVIEKEGPDIFNSLHNAPGLFLPLVLTRSAPAGTDAVMAREARRIGIPAYDLSSFYFRHQPRLGILVGTGRMSLKAIPNMARQLIAATRQTLNSLS